MRVRISAQLVFLAIAVLPGIAAADLWKCEVKAVYKPNEKGKLTEVAKPNFMHGAELGDSLYYDEASGIVRMVSKKYNKTAMELKFRSWQKSSSENSAVALYLQEGSGSNPAYLLRIKAWEAPISFTLDEQWGAIITGLCQSIAPR